MSLSSCSDASGRRPVGTAGTHLGGV